MKTICKLYYQPKMIYCEGYGCQPSLPFAGKHCVDSWKTSNYFFGLHKQKYWLGFGKRSFTESAVTDGGKRGQAAVLEEFQVDTEIIDVANHTVCTLQNGCKVQREW